LTSAPENCSAAGHPSGSPDKPRRLLNILIEHGNELVIHAEIQRELRPNDTIVRL
jgi:hypothetical protein